ncbi:proton-conducting transporter membrane subunit, partial [Candidatus Neomarinimicrobiota bacterium]
LTGFIVGIVLVDVFLKRARRNLVVWILSLIALVVAGIFLALQQSPAEGIFYGALAIDPYSRFFKWIFLLATFVIYLVSPYTKELDSNPRHEYYLFLLVVVFGMFLMVSALDLIIVYLSIEIVSLGSFVLAGFLKRDQLSNESSLKYVIYGALSSGVMLYGLSLLFGMSLKFRLPWQRFPVKRISH